MNWQITDVEYLTDYKLLVSFRDGSRKIVDLQTYLDDEVLEPLRDKDYFKTVKVDPEFDSIYWDNGSDITPEYIIENGIEQ